MNLRMTRRLILASLLYFSPFFPTATAEETDTITVWNRNWDGRYKIKVLLDYTVDDFGPYQLKKSIPMEEGRAMHQLEDGDDMDILWLAATNEREEMLLPVYIYMGGRSQGYRVCLIGKNQQYRFDNINTLDDWKHSGMIMGSGTHWADTEILEYNGIQVVTNPVSRYLYKQLGKDRFDAFPRGIDEIESNLKKHASKQNELELAVEERLMFVYPLRKIIYLSKGNEQLKKRLEIGYQRALADGVWQKLFGDGSEHVSREQELNLNKRLIIQLENPFLSEKVLAMPMFDHAPFSS